MRMVPVLASLLAASPVFADPVALHCGEVFDSRSAKLVGARTIVAENGPIREVLPGRATVAGARVVDLSGHSCMPGNPVSDISLTRKVDFVMKDGAPVPGSFGID